MPTPQFEWKPFHVSLPSRSPLRGLVAKPMPTEEEESVLSLAAAPSLTSVPLPVLQPNWPTPGDKAKILLETAAEIEHALMVQYLYSAYSLKDPGEVTNSAQRAALRKWPVALASIAREEMGHLATVQNLLLLLGGSPNFEREDFPPRKELYPFLLHLEPLTQKSLAKYVVAESPLDAQGIDDIIAQANETSGTPINHVGVLYGLLGLIFATAEQVQTGGSGSEAWDEMVRHLSLAAYQQAPPECWHLPESAFHADSRSRQASPDDWQTGGGIRVHLVQDRQEARQAIRDIGEQGEGLTNGGQQSHFERFKNIYRGADGLPAFPGMGEWVPTRDVPIAPKPEVDFPADRTRRWVELADIRYALLLGFLEHYFYPTSVLSRNRFVGWVFAEMRSRLGFIARRLTEMPRSDAGPAVAGVAFTLPEGLHLPHNEQERWAVHQQRTLDAITKVEAMQAANETDKADPYLNDLLASDRARLKVIEAQLNGQGDVSSFGADILPLFRPVDIQHMKEIAGLDLSVYAVVKEQATTILERLQGIGALMPPSPDQPWTKGQIDLFSRWIADHFPE